MSNYENKEHIDGEGEMKDAKMGDSNLTQDSVYRGKSKIEVREKKGLLRSAIPQIGLPFAWIVLFFNVFIPGLGTLLLSLCALCGVSTDLDKSHSKCLVFLINFLTAILQVITAVVIVGWIWSVYWGMYAVTEANERKIRKKTMKQQEMNQPNQELKRYSGIEEQTV